MQLDGHATNQDLNTLLDFLCDSDDTSFPVQRKVINLNVALEELVGKIINADGTWQYDDTNYTNHPVGTGTLVEGQEDYAFAGEYLQVEAVEILNSASPAQYIRLTPLDHNELGGRSTEEYFGLTSAGNPQTGMPEYFDIVGDTVRLYPAPTSSRVTLAAGLKIYFKRAPDLFTTTDTTQEPGLPSPYHSLLVYKAAIPYCIKYHKDRIPEYQIIIENMTKDLISHYSNREKSKRARIVNRRKSFR